MSGRAVLIDFDGTLGWREGLWGGTVLELLDEHDPAHGLAIDRLREGLRDGFPWHRADTGHPELADPDAWWAPVSALAADAVRGAGGSEAHAAHVAQAIRGRFADPSRGWALFADSLPALARLRASGYRIVVLSNHIPELGAITAGLGLDPFVDAVLTSAEIGWEKPNPEAFRIGREAAGDPQELWMIGDNPRADVAGAEAVGIPAIRVRTGEPGARSVPDVAAAAALILGS